MGCEFLFTTNCALDRNSHPTGQNPESTVCVANPGTRLAPLENDELLPQTQVLSHQSRLGFQDGGEAANKVTNHLLMAFRLLQSDQRSSTEPTSNAIDG